MSSPVNPVNNEEKEKILEGALTEMRSKYQNLNDDYSNLGTKIFTLMATELVIATFMFTFKINEHAPLFNFESLSSIIFFGIGIACIFVALAILFWSVTSNLWAVPAEMKELNNLNYRNNIDFLEETKNDYIAAHAFCQGRFAKRRMAFDMSVIAFAIGAIILMVIKIGG